MEGLAKPRAGAPFAAGDSVIGAADDGWTGSVVSVSETAVTVRSPRVPSDTEMPLEQAIESLRVVETAEGERSSCAWAALVKMPAFSGICGCPSDGEKRMLSWRPSMTAYSWDGKGHDPNRPKLMCGECWESYEQMMQSWWDEYRNSCGI